MSCTAVMTGSVAKTGLAGAILALLAGLKELTPAKRETSERAALLLDRHGESVLRCAYSYLHNMADAEEVLQDTLVQYLKHAPELSDQLAGEGREDLSFVWEAVKSLPESYREAVHLFYYEGLSTAQISGILGRSETAVRSALHRGRRKLKEILREDYDFEIR